MNNYYLKRTIRAVLTVWIVITVTFGMIRLLPGGPLEQLRGKLLRQGVSPSRVNAMIESYQNVRPNQSLPEQYYEYMTALLTGDMGQSFLQKEPVTAIIGDALPWTVFVMATSTLLIFLIAIVWGALMAYREGSTFDLASSSASILFAAMPFYVLGIVLIIVFGYQLELLPTSHRLSPDVEPGLSLLFVLDAIDHAILPIASMVLTGAGLQVLAMRGNAIQVLGSDFVRVARLRGLSDRRISVRYVARNAILPMYTGFLTLIGFNLGGSIILEQVFSYPGIGYYMFQALEARDYPLMMGIFLIITIALVLAVYIADLTYGLIDPRVKSGDSRETY
ncbi:ABC transporter permease [Halocatena salina]|uniref:ABC transporter permease n=1 Tax=Halocatena salina TaxID=2934340 RepID=A0A8U0A6A3_9EURY|nr:ABC transporter permease [Halocatena salina]UPM44406.1 ABC transporter permease [Halocatena salina]